MDSFLEDGKNDDLIRWSDKGDSFIVLDEDEFAKTLIPNLYKHNKYASFVRQLNMYGFHKRVGLSDNSMRASERKHKNPSEYHNPFFRRGHPDLLWLINKTKSKAPAKNKGEDDGEGDDELGNEGGGDGTGASGSGATAGRALPAAGDAQQSTAPKKEMTVIREELNKVRDQQKMILTAINRLQRHNADLYSQALMFQNQHDRHQNSINAILNFLANVFRKTLEDQGNSQNINDIISSMITNQGQGGAHNQASVVDLGDLFSAQADQAGSLGGMPKRARGLLPPIPSQDNSGGAKPSTSTSTRSTSTGSTPYYPVGGHHQNPEMGHVTELIDSSETPPNLRQELENNPHERMMKIINDHNATNKSGLDLPEAEELVANAPNALNRDQRSKLVDFMAGQASASPPSATQTPTPSAGPSSSPKGTAPAASTAKPSVETGGGNNTGTMPSLSPIMRSPQAVPPSINEINTNQMDLAQLQRLQSEQDAKIHELSEMLGPLSPSGRIPGLADGEDGYFNEPSNVDLDQFFDSNAFLNDANFGADGNDFNFNIDADGNAVQGGDDNDENNPSPANTEEIEREDDFNGTPDRAKKRRVG